MKNFYEGLIIRAPKIESRIHPPVERQDLEAHLEQCYESKYPLTYFRWYNIKY
ncbi:unnamed protein product, partial [Ceratitis capitata]